LAALLGSSVRISGIVRQTVVVRIDEPLVRPTPGATRVSLAERTIDEFLRRQVTTLLLALGNSEDVLSVLHALGGDEGVSGSAVGSLRSDARAVTGLAPIDLVLLLALALELFLGDWGELSFFGNGLRVEVLAEHLSVEFFSAHVRKLVEAEFVAQVLAVDGLDFLVILPEVHESEVHLRWAGVESSVLG
jgi:hypothetical protein